VAYFAASVDDADTNRKFAESLGLDFPILSDPDRKTAEAYGVLIPVVRVASRKTFYIGADGKILYIDTGVKPSTAGRDVAGRLEELKIPKRKGAAPTETTGGSSK
jgi:peroxiredoxin Q/BCP